MKCVKLIGLFLLSHLCAVGAVAEITIQVGNYVVVEGTDSVEVTIEVVGGGEFQDVAGIIQVGDGGPLVGGIAGPRITAVNYSGSVWEDVTGGYNSFFASQGPPEQIIDPQVGVEDGLDRAVATGILMRITVDLTGFGPGVYPIRMGNTAGGDTMVYLDNSEEVVTINNGFIRVRSDLDIWREAQFPGIYPNSFLEETVWGDTADPDLDGIENCLEYAFGSDPNQAADAGASTLTPGVPRLEIVQFNGQPQVRLFYCTRPAAGWTYDLQIVGDLNGVWGNRNSHFIELAPATPIGNTGYMYHQKRYNRPLPAVQFFRVHVSKD